MGESEEVEGYGKEREEGEEELEEEEWEEKRWRRRKWRRGRREQRWR